MHHIPTLSDLYNNKHQKKTLKKSTKAFTLIEILVVIFVISILFLAMQNSFQPAQRAVVYSEICTNDIFARVRTHLNNAYTSRSFSWNITPSNYWFNFLPSQQKIEFLHGETITSSLTLWTWTRVQHCHNAWYSVLLTGEDTTYTIQAGGQESTLTQASWLFTGQTVLQLCQWPVCEDFFRILLDARTHMITRQSCLSFRDTCLKRQ